ncbi:uncharacterized protein LOC129722741 [Wyeomyia smithii]|uniref:uncharacterized protein LOC129722741 n=1 Tax=Wyeomyia smithii TaxID=174621 RepID=UPI0024681AAD|nr:uncharacterized protein LOC129722741 [Wyeomyia smithii]XP_055532413.1 uncharacterized protein LOC129722741 [Wyeomyia smithii]XP_055532414.1 uncharacterized protein LOC129722741 [Wyeomyia smithii]
MASRRTPLLHAQTITIIVLVIGGQIQTAASATLQQDEHRSATTDVTAPRTFGRIRMMKNFMIPMMFILGSIKMLLLLVAAVSVKTLFVASIILVINISVGLAKVINFFKHHKFGFHQEQWAGGIEKNVNIHLHSDPNHHFSLEGPPSIHSTVHTPSYPYARNDVVEPVYYLDPIPATPSSLYQKQYMKQATATQNLPYSRWPQYIRKR